MERLIEEDKESSSDESDETNISKMLIKSQNPNRSSERDYKSHFRLSPNASNKKFEEINEWKENEKDEKKKRNQIPKRKARYRKAGDMDSQKKSKFFDEEMLVNYYVINLIMMEKKTDALKAINEYLRKPGISELGRANLLKTYA